MDRGDSTSSASRDAHEASRGRESTRLRLPRLDLSPLAQIPHVQVIAVVLVIVLCGLIVYPAARDNYITLRNNERLSAELSAVQARNDQLSSQVEALSTDEGVEDAARELGWTRAGEEAMVVRGMDADTTLALPDTVTTSSISAPGHWYTPVLDFLFHVDTTTPLLVDSYSGDVTGGAARVVATQSGAGAPSSGESGS